MNPPNLRHYSCYCHLLNLRLRMAFIACSDCLGFPLPYLDLLVQLFCAWHSKFRRQTVGNYCCSTWGLECPASGRGSSLISLRSSDLLLPDTFSCHLSRDRGAAGFLSRPARSLHGKEKGVAFGLSEVLSSWRGALILEIWILRQWVYSYP